MVGAKNCRSASRFLPAIAGVAARVSVPRNKTAVRAEPVEALPFLFEEVEPFDKLRANGAGERVMRPLTAAD